jgi:hypothetical protein
MHYIQIAPWRTVNWASGIWLSGRPKKLLSFAVGASFRQQFVKLSLFGSCNAHVFLTKFVLFASLVCRALSGPRTYHQTTSCSGSYVLVLVFALVLLLVLVLVLVLLLLLVLGLGLGLGLVLARIHTHIQHIHTYIRTNIHIRAPGYWSSIKGLRIPLGLVEYEKIDSGRFEG